MDNLRPESHKEKKDSSTRLLKRLKIALIVWLVCLVAFIIWFVFSSHAEF